jgi:hypothetical protein
LFLGKDLNSSLIWMLGFQYQNYAHYGRPFKINLRLVSDVSQKNFDLHKSEFYNQHFLRGIGEFRKVPK